MSSEFQSIKNIKVTFEAVIPPSAGPNGELIAYDLQTEQHLINQMMVKIDLSIKQFGSFEKFIELFKNELNEKKDAATLAVQSYEMRRRQLEFLEDYYLKNRTPKVEGLDR